MTTSKRLTTNTTSLAREVVRRSLSVEFAGLSSLAVDKLKNCILDFLSCAFEARNLDWSQQAISIAPKIDDACTILGTDFTSSPMDAAFANATMGHGLVREDMHAGSISHFGVVVWPVLFALAQTNSISGKRFLSAAAIGYEVGGRIGRKLINADLARLYRPTGIVGPLAGAVAGSYLLAHGEEVSVSALSLSANASAGLNQWPHDGGSDMYFHPGAAARGALTAIALAGAGAHGSDLILEGEAGLFAAYRREDAPQDIVLFPDHSEEILAVYNKPVPACNFAQTACQAALRVAEEIEAISDIESITVLLPEAAIRYPGCDYIGPFVRSLQAKMSIQYGVAGALMNKAVVEANYHQLENPDLLQLVRMVNLKTDVEFSKAFPAQQGAEVVIALKRGGTISRRIPDVVAATEAEIRARFRCAAKDALGADRADAIEGAVDDLEKLEDAGHFIELCGSKKVNGKNSSRAKLSRVRYAQS